MKKIFFYSNKQKIAISEQYEECAGYAKANGLEVVSDANEAEAIVTLGGDGTILRAINEKFVAPVLGVNFGGLGYLASLTYDDFIHASRQLANGEYAVRERAMLTCGGRDALNDIVVQREMSGHAALFELKADEQLVATYLADGLIFSTPTGSTAYSLAAGGPVMMPDADVTVVTPMNPHALGIRPLVVRSDVRFTVSVRSRTAGNDLSAAVYADGEKVRSLDEGESVAILPSARKAKFIELDGNDPYVVLERKLGWARRLGALYNRGLNSIY